ncbi:MAG: glycosyltransferase [Actinomycetota bacterium]
MLATVPVPPKRLDDYVDSAGEEAVDRLREVARPLAGSRLLMINSTAFGGGVAELLFTQVALLQDLGIETTWAVLEGSDDYYAVTKAVHNALQGAPLAWTSEMERIYRERIRANAAQLTEAFDVVFVHDPQPAALIEILEDEDRKEGRWLWRCHIDLSTPHPPVWAFFEPIVNRYGAAIFTMEAFSQPGVTAPVAFVPPSIDPISPKNSPMNDETMHEVLTAYGIDPQRPMITQVSRFDPWKDPLGVIDAFRLAREEHPELQLVMAGSMASDDPEGMEFLDRTEAHREGDPDIHLLTNLHNVGNLEVNAFQSASAVVVQKSTREGFGLVVSEGMWKGKPVVGGDVGGITLQIEDGVCGYLVDSVETCAAKISELIADPDLRERMGRAGRDRVRDRFLCLREIEDYLRLLSPPHE